MIQFANRIKNLEGTATREVLKLLRAGDIISFAGGVPCNSVLPKDEMGKLCDRLFLDNPKILSYGETEGVLEFREELVNYVKSFSITASLDNILVVSGAQQGIDLAFSCFLEKGDTVLVENPTYLAVLQILQSFEVKVIGVNSDSDGLCLTDLEEKIKKHSPKLLYVVPTFSNPTGSTYSIKNRKGILQLCRHSGIVIVEDDPYSPLRYEGEATPSIKGLARNGDGVIFISSFSKLLSPGLRVGFVVADAPVARKMAIAKQGSDLHTPILSQMLICEFVKSGIDKVVNNAKRVYKERRDTMEGALKNEMGERLIFTSPKGGLFIWGQAAKGIDTKKLLTRAIEKKVAYIAGEEFFVDKNKKNYLRLSFSTATKSQIEEGVKRLAELI